MKETQFINWNSRIQIKLKYRIQIIINVYNTIETDRMLQRFYAMLLSCIFFITNGTHITSCFSSSLVFFLDNKT